MRVNSLRAMLPMLMLIVAACGAPATAEPTSVPPTVVPTVEQAAAPTAVPTAAPTEAATVAPTPEAVSEATAAPAAEAPQLSFAPATYRDESAGFALEYPADWTLDPSSQVGVRGGQALLLSPGTTPETLADGGTRVSIVTYLWDPKNDLDAYIAQRKIAWEASGFAITREETWQLADGRAAQAFIINTPEQPAFFLFTTAGEDYLQIGGDGDLALIEEIARTLRFGN